MPWEPVLCLKPFTLWLWNIHTYSHTELRGCYNKMIKIKCKTKKTHGIPNRVWNEARKMKRCEQDRLLKKARRTRNEIQKSHITEQKIYTHKRAHAVRIHRPHIKFRSKNYRLWNHSHFDIHISHFILLAFYLHKYFECIFLSKCCDSKKHNKL